MQEYTVSEQNVFVEDFSIKFIRALKGDLSKIVSANNNGKWAP